MDTDDTSESYICIRVQFDPMVPLSVNYPGNSTRVNHNGLTEAKWLTAVWKFINL